MGEYRDYRVASRGLWGTHEEGSLSVERLNLGCRLRIADAMELMSKNHAQLIDERDRYAKWLQEERIRVQTLRHRIRALQGVITRQKRKTK